jgi:quinol monooxygenase YgiN
VYQVVWEFMAAAGREAEFERAYGPDGDWVRLFRRDPAYLGTDLLRDPVTPNRFLTVDRWTSEAACDAFARQHRAAYQEIDARLAPLCDRELKIGAFTVTSWPPPPG